MGKHVRIARKIPKNYKVEVTLPDIKRHYTAFIKNTL